MWVLPWAAIALVVALASGSRSGWRTSADFPKK